MNILSRWLIRSDMPEVLEIEKLCFKDHPWQKEDFLGFLRQRNCIGLAHEIDNKIVGFIIYELHERYYRILNLAIHPDFQRQGLGSKFIDHLSKKLNSSRNKLETFVVETNLDAQLFFSELNLKATHIEKDYFDCGYYFRDAYHFEYILGRSLNNRCFDEVCEGA